MPCIYQLGLPSTRIFTINTNQRMLALTLCRTKLHCYRDKSRAVTVGNIQVLSAQTNRPFSLWSFLRERHKQKLLLEFVQCCHECVLNVKCLEWPDKNVSEALSGKTLGNFSMAPFYGSVIIRNHCKENAVWSLVNCNICN